MVASIKNLNSSSLFCFYCRPNPGSNTSLRKVLSLSSPSLSKKTHWQARNENLWHLVDGRESRQCPTARSTNPVLGYLCDSHSVSLDKMSHLCHVQIYLHNLLWISEGMLVVDFSLDAVSAQRLKRILSILKRPLYIYGLCYFCVESTYEVLISFNRIPLDRKTNIYKTFTFLSGV